MLTSKILISGLGRIFSNRERLSKSFLDDVDITLEYDLITKKQSKLSAKKRRIISDMYDKYHKKLD